MHVSLLKKLLDCGCEKDFMEKGSILKKVGVEKT
jgi:hypothetical protein